MKNRNLKTKMLSLLGAGFLSGPGIAHADHRDDCLDRLAQCSDEASNFYPYCVAAVDANPEVTDQQLWDYYAACGEVAVQEYARCSDEFNSCLGESSDDGRCDGQPSWRCGYC